MINAMKEVYAELLQKLTQGFPLSPVRFGVKKVFKEEKPLSRVTVSDADKSTKA